MSLSLIMPQKYWGFSTKLESPESNMPSSEEGGLAPKFIKRSETARSSSFPRTDDPGNRPKRTGEKALPDVQIYFSLAATPILYNFE